MALPARHSRNLQPKVKRTRPGDSKAHLAFIRTLPCCVTGRTPVEAHHLLRADSLPKGTSRKHLDRYAIPLAPEIHRAVHDHGNDEAWLADRGIQGIDLANALWSVTQNKDPDERYEAALRIVERSKRVEAHQ